MNAPTRLLATLAIAVAVLAACGGEDESPTTTAAAGATTAGPATTASPSTGAPATTQPGASTSAAAGAAITVSGRQEHRTGADGETVHCDGGGEVYVRHNGVTVTGECSDVDVLSNGAVLTVEATTDLDVEGNDNTIAAGTVRDVDISGSGNVVTVDSAVDIDVEGNDNTVTFATGTPDIDDEGTGNTITQG